MTSQIRAILDRFPTIQAAYLFGSCASGAQTPRSDLDLAFVSTRTLLAKEVIALTEALAERFNRPIDLVDLRQVASPLLREVLSKGISILDSSLDSRAELMRRLLDYETDFMPVYRQAQRERQEAFAHG